MKNIAWVGFFVGASVFLLFLFSSFTPDQRLSMPYSQVMLAHNGSMLRVYLNDNEQYLLPPELMREVPDKLRQAVLSFEDRRFYEHPGVDPLALSRAIWQNIGAGKVTSGGSTLTMQLARMVYNQPRTYTHKLSEALLALKLEAHYSKDQLLKAYLGHAPYGGNIRGVMAASYRYFGKKPKELTWSEAALLAVLPNAPGVISPSINQQILQAKRDRLLRRMLDSGVLNQQMYELSLLEPIPQEVLPFPLHAPHLTDRIHAENDLSVVQTTIDPAIQYDATFFTRQHLANLAPVGIRNACALVVENKTGAVRAYVGSQDYHDFDTQGRVDGVSSARSSGSILKPFLYALSIDDGHILPQTMIKDVPTYFESFSPSNASEKFGGVSRASDALIHSLNVPAVRLLNKYGVVKFYNQLKAAGVSTLFRKPDEYGLPLILGGAEVSPWDMAILYRGMANYGSFGQISYLQNDPQNKGQQLLSAGASYLILEELKELIRPGLEFYWKKYSSQKPVAWKTGTSYGHKDAWAVGTTPEWTVVVWVGNFDGTANNSLLGMKRAGPLLFQIMNSLPASHPSWFEKPENAMTEVTICPETGFYAGQFCESPVQVAAPKGMKPLAVCPYHEPIQVEMIHEMTHEVCSHCWSADRKTLLLLRYTPDINYYLRQSGTLSAVIPPHHPSCPAHQARGELEIIYPLSGATIFLPRNFGGDYEAVVSKVATQHPDRELFWYLNDELLGSTVGTSTFPLRMKQGTHLLTVTDEEGNRDQVRFSIATR